MVTPSSPCAGRRVHHVGRELARLVDAGRARRDDLARELLDRLLEGFLFGGELENHIDINTKRHEAHESARQHV